MFRPKDPLSLSDETLVQRFKRNGDIEVLGILFNRYAHLVYGVSLKYLKHREDAQDAVNNIFEELVVKVTKHEVLNFKSWLFVLTKNHCLMVIRKSKHMETAEESDFAFMENSSSLHLMDEINVEDDLVRLEECIAKLRTDQRNCVELFFLQKKCYQEIVDSTNHALKKVKSYIQNGKRNLKICLEKSE